MFITTGPNRVSDPFRHPSAAAIGTSDSRPSSGRTADTPSTSATTSHASPGPRPSRRDNRANATPQANATTTSSVLPTSGQCIADSSNPACTTVPVMGATNVCRPRKATAFTYPATAAMPAALWVPIQILTLASTACSG